MKPSPGLPPSSAGGVARRLRYGADTPVAVIQTFGALVLGTGYLILAVLDVTAYGQYRHLIAPWWLPVHAAGLLLCGGLLLAAAGSDRSRRLANAALVCWVFCIFTNIAWLLAWNGENLGLETVGDRPILQGTFMHMPAIALVLARHYRAAAFALVTCVLSGAFTIGALSYGRLDTPLWVATAWSIGVASVYVALARALMLAAVRMDDERRAELDAAREGTWYTARDREGRRLDALVHDRIIALLSELGSDRADDYTAEQARGILETLDHWSVEADAEPPGRELRAEEVSRRLSTAVAEVGGAAGVQVDLDPAAGDPTIGFPFDAVVALGDAAVEAVRNALRHAGPGATCLAAITVRPDVLSVAVVDDGAGFDVEAVDTTSIGLQIAIRERMRRVDGGSVDVQSARGRGTRVRLQWDRPTVAAS
ncbi:sensor histidine kinase [Gordonia sp. VNK21]|uniref:sensor histidine kinase n=1 Tax=Gordonia sp. VNK21 TaxID=3382483 RepID=UPI0038D4FBC7